MFLREKYLTCKAHELYGRGVEGGEPEGNPPVRQGGYRDHSWGNLEHQDHNI